MNEPPEDRRTLDYARPSTSSRRRMNVPRLVGVFLILVMGLFLAVALLLPQLGRAREPANRIKCENNMKQIGLAAIDYANRHDGHFPDDLGTILESEDLAPAVFNCPSTNDQPAAGPTTRAIVADLSNPGRESYIYVGKGLTTDAPADVVVLYEPLSDHQNDGMNVLFADGHVDWLTAAQAQPILKHAAAGLRPIRWSPTTAPAPATAPMTRVVDRVQQ